MLAKVLRLALLGAAILVGFAAAPGPARAEATPTAFIQGMADQALGILSNNSMSEQQRTDAFSKLFTQNFDVPTIGRFVLGRYWRTATPTQQSEYLNYFGKYVVAVYADRFSTYKGGVTFKATSAQQTATDTTTVNSIIDRSGGAPPINIGWIVVNQGGQYRVVDVVAENLSMRLTQRDEFASVIERNGGNVQALIDLLKQKVAQGN
jgi:phospholipid transport system substrate-binding protein